MKPRQAVMGAIHEPAALHRIAEAIAVAASEEASSAVELRNLPATIFSIGVHSADEPRSLTAEATGSPMDRHSLVNGLPNLAV